MRSVQAQKLETISLAFNAQLRLANCAKTDRAKELGAHVKWPRTLAAET